MKRILAFFVLLLCLADVRAQQALDDIEFSLITCSPGTEVYSLYGHTGLRCRNKSLATDLVFNFGIFDFATPNFAWRFAMGQTDYIVAAVPWHQFSLEYSRRGSIVHGQILNLNAEESNRLFRMLVENCLPENRVYRYNYLTNNCTTRVRDYLEQCVQGTIEWPAQEPLKTYRQIMHEYTASSLWAQEGNDILLGQNVDTLLDSRAMLFVPEYLQNAASGAVIRSRTEDTRRLVLAEQVLTPKRVQLDHPGFVLTPLQCSVIFFAVMLLIMALELFFRRRVWLVDILVMTAQGAAGVILLFLFLFSEHPTLDSNWQIWLYNPFPLLIMPAVVRAAYRHKHCPWHVVNAAILASFILFSPWIPQTFCQSSIPVALGLLTRPLGYYLHYSKLCGASNNATDR